MTKKADDSCVHVNIAPSFFKKAIPFVVAGVFSACASLGMVKVSDYDASPDPSYTIAMNDLQSRIDSLDRRANYTEASYKAIMQELGSIKEANEKSNEYVKEQLALTNIQVNESAKLSSKILLMLADKNFR
jgi:hypothetical protein